MDISNPDTFESGFPGNIKTVIGMLSGSCWKVIHVKVWMEVQ